MARTAYPSHNQSTRFRVLEKARENLTELLALKPLLSREDEETLAILMDKKLTTHLEKSLREAEKGQLEPLEHILDK